ncbi:Elongator complex protein 4 [Paragonimus heterotremus]|uniref:Elongator complex protein 4 n=1 Tax=Paragonimus heterotremus TaxID=100268 RepID=A0A8J4TB80_9TREM|nr:Elongator complex protein 4 [Paragonimus heterotremus]
MWPPLQIQPTLPQMSSKLRGGIKHCVIWRFAFYRAFAYYIPPSFDCFHQTSPSSLSLGHYFDLSKLMDTDARIKERDLLVTHFAPQPTSSLQANISNMIKTIYTFCHEKKAPVDNIRRIVLHSLFSPCWGFVSNVKTFDRLVLKCFISLRLMLQNSLNVALITLPRLEPGLTSRLRHYADYVFSLKGFDGIESRNPLYEEYDGLMTAIRLPWLGNSLEPAARPTTIEWAFKVKRRQFVLQHLHLPPCLSNTVSRSNATEAISSCAKLPGTDVSAIDF